MATPTTAARPDLHAEVEVTIDALAHGGAGVARLDGYVLFVRDAIPGDRVRAEVTKRKRAYGEARTLEVLAPSPERIPPVARHPGAPWQVLPYDRQLEVKAQQVDDALRRIGRLDGFALEPIVPSAEQWRYRNKVEFSFGTAADGALVCGFHAAGSWEEIVDMEDCLLVSERVNAMRRTVVDFCRAQGLEAWDRRTQQGFLRNLVIREGRRTGQLQVRLVTSPGELDGEAFAAAAAADGTFWTQAAGMGETTHGGLTEHIAGAPALEEELSGLRYAIAPDAFFQTNTEMAEALYGIAVDYAELRGWERVYDLYCGIGTIGLALAGRAGEVWGVEVVEQAVANAIANARRNEVSNAQFFAGDVRLAMRDLVERAGRPDVSTIWRSARRTSPAKKRALSISLRRALAIASAIASSTISRPHTSPARGASDRPMVPMPQNRS